VTKATPPPRSLWTGWDARSGTRADPAAVEAFKETDAQHSISESRYELLAVAARGFRPPQFLTSVEIGAASDPDSTDILSPERPGLRETWSLLYRRIVETAPRTQVPYAIYLLGVNPPADTTDAELEVFNEFYSSVHLVEVAQQRHALRAVRYELDHEVRAPYQGAPRFLAVYEMDETSASKRRHVGPPYSKGPEVWQGHTTPWRLWYRRLGHCAD
jgi:hypothetical protein